MIISRFSQRSKVFTRFQRMLYWMPKFKHMNPWPVPRPPPKDPTQLAVMALKRMSFDLQTKITVVNVSCIIYFRTISCSVEIQSLDLQESVGLRTSSGIMLSGANSLNYIRCFLSCSFSIYRCNNFNKVFFLLYMYMPYIIFARTPEILQLGSL